MKRILAGRFVALTLVLALGCAATLLAVSFAAQTSPQAAADPQAPRIGVSPVALDFGAVGVQRTKDLSLRIWNVGGGVLSGTAAAEGPFTLRDAAYSLKSGQSKTLTVRYKPAAPGTNTGAIVLSGADTVRVRVTARAGVPPPPPQRVRFITPEEVDRADLIVRYSDERTSYVVKPPMQEAVPRHAFYSPFTSAEVVKLAAGQPRRALAIVVLPRFRPGTAEAGDALTVQADQGADWQKHLAALASDLRKAGYQSLVFCEGGSKVGKIAGLRVVEGPRATSL